MMKRASNQKLIPSPQAFEQLKTAIRNKSIQELESLFNIYSVPHLLLTSFIVNNNEADSYLPIHFACSLPQNKKMIEHLLDRYVSIDEFKVALESTTSNGLNGLLLACQARDVTNLAAILHFCQRYGNIVDFDSILQQTTQNGLTCIKVAIKSVVVQKRNCPPNDTNQVEEILRSFVEFLKTLISCFPTKELFDQVLVMKHGRRGKTALDFALLLRENHGETTNANATRDEDATLENSSSAQPLRQGTRSLLNLREQQRVSSLSLITEILSLVKNSPDDPSWPKCRSFAMFPELMSMISRRELGAIRALFGVYSAKEFLLHLNGLGVSALHQACTFDESGEIVDLFLEVAQRYKILPRVLCHVDNSNRLPLWHALRHEVVPFLTLKKLLRFYAQHTDLEKVLATEDSNGLTLLAVAVSNFISQHQQPQQPESISEILATSSGLQLIIASFPTTELFVRTLLKPDRKGNKPLAKLSKTNHRSFFLNLLVNKDPVHCYRISRFLHIFLIDGGECQHDYPLSLRSLNEIQTGDWRTSSSSSSSSTRRQQPSQQLLADLLRDCGIPPEGNPIVQEGLDCLTAAINSCEQEVELAMSLWEATEVMPRLQEIERDWSDEANRLFLFFTCDLVRQRLCDDQALSRSRIHSERADEFEEIQRQITRIQDRESRQLLESWKLGCWSASQRDRPMSVVNFLFVISAFALYHSPKHLRKILINPHPVVIEEDDDYVDIGDEDSVVVSKYKPDFDVTWGYFIETWKCVKEKLDNDTHDRAERKATATAEDLINEFLRSRDEYGIHRPFFANITEFVLGSNTFNLVKMTPDENLSMFGSQHQFCLARSAHQEREREFERLKAECGTKFCFHGFSGHHTLGILRYGLKNASETNLMVNQAVHGSGIYLSPLASTSYPFSNIDKSVSHPEAHKRMQDHMAEKYISIHEDFGIIAVCEVINNEHLKIATDDTKIWVMPKEDHVAVRFLIVFTRGHSFGIDLDLEEERNTKILKETWRSVKERMENVQIPAERPL